ncbi:RNase III inhibitor [Oscillospiraceae bacterium HV4-5-C5C]|nr:RNase III inhibitor [Oscillospiraceae bacterium HV4-5-C5C]
MPFEIVQNDLVSLSVDAVVSPANPAPVIGPGVDYAIHQKAGPALLTARQQIGQVDRGDAVITPGFALAASYVIHTVGPDWVDGKHQEEQLLSSCYQKSLALAKAQRCRSVAVPLLAAGNYGFPKPLALQIAIHEISRFLLENELQVYLVVFDKQAYALSEKLFKSVSSYIDDHYIRRKILDEYGAPQAEGPQSEARRRRQALNQNQPGHDTDWPNGHDTDWPTRNPGEALEVLASTALPGPADDWGQLLKNLDAGFAETLLQLIDRTGKKDPEIYKKANVDRKLFSKIRHNMNYQPTKTTALAFAFALELDVAETRDFIGRAGYALSHSSIFDVIVEYFLVNRNYNVFELNEVLFAFDQPLIGA